MPAFANTVVMPMSGPCSVASAGRIALITSPAGFAPVSASAQNATSSHTAIA